jgi:hypothetical protein
MFAVVAAIRAGDYYLFDDTEEIANQEEDLKTERGPVDSLTFGANRGEEGEEKRANPLQVRLTEETTLQSLLSQIFFTCLHCPHEFGCFYHGCCLNCFAIVCG